MKAGIPDTVLPRAEARLAPLSAEKWSPRGIWLISSFTSAVRKSSKPGRRTGEEAGERIAQVSATPEGAAAHLLSRAAGCSPSASHKSSLGWTHRLPLPPPLFQQALELVGPVGGGDNQMGRSFVVTLLRQRSNEHKDNALSQPRLRLHWH